jgi:hypothetical protein
MAEHYLDALTVNLWVYSGYPLPENLKEALSLSIDVGGLVDLDQLTDDIREVVKEQQNRIQQNYSQINWGAEAYAAELIVQISSVMSGVGGIAGVWALISQKARRHGEARILTGDAAAQFARTWVAQNQNFNTNDIRVIGIEAVGDGYRIGLETSIESFTVEMDGNGVYRMVRN